MILSHFISQMKDTGEYEGWKCASRSVITSRSKWLLEYPKRGPLTMHHHGLNGNALKHQATAHTLTYGGNSIKNFHHLLQFRWEWKGPRQRVMDRSIAAWTQHWRITTGSYRFSLQLCVLLSVFKAESGLFGNDAANCLLGLRVWMFCSSTYHRQYICQGTCDARNSIFEGPENLLSDPMFKQQYARMKIKKITFLSRIFSKLTWLD